MDSAANFDDIDERGDQNAIPDALWSEIWTSWSDTFRQEYFASVAEWGPLTIEQCCQAIQGLPPMPKGWDEQNTCLDQYSALVGRLKSDIGRGALPGHPTAMELAAWCDVMLAALPCALVQALSDLARSPTAAESSPQSVLKIEFPAWVPAGIATASDKDDSAPTKPKRGRPRVAPGTYANIEKEAARILMINARSGNKTTIHELAAEVRNMGLAPGMDQSTVEARLKGKLPIEKARLTAAKVNRTLG